MKVSARFLPALVLALALLFAAPAFAYTGYDGYPGQPTQDQGGWNGTGYSDKGVDEQIHRLRQEVDETKRNASIAALWHKLKDEVIYVPLHNQTITYAMSREFDIPVDVSSQPKMKFVGARRIT